MSIVLSEPAATVGDASRQRIDEATRFISRNLLVGSDVARALLEASARDLGLPVAEVADDFIRGILFD